MPVFIKATKETAQLTYSVLKDGRYVFMKAIEDTAHLTCSLFKDAGYV